MDPTSAPAPHPAFEAPAYRRAYRDTRTGWVGGVAAGLAEHLGWPLLWVRAGFVLLTSLGGLGVLLYLAFWVFLPAGAGWREVPPGLASAERGGRRPLARTRWDDAGPLAALAALGLGVLLLVAAATGRATTLVPVVVAGVGVALLWRQADQAQRERWFADDGPAGAARVVLGSGGWGSVLRVVGGLVLVVAAFVLFAWRGGGLGAARDLTLAAVVALLGLALVVGPWVYRLGTDLSEERAARVRSQERADVAAHLHDSVLQTLALIRTHSGDPQLVGRLARAQERDLRAWLYEDLGAPGATDTVAAALKRAAAELEDLHGVPVEVVAVGDAEPGPAAGQVPPETAQAVVAAAREAIANAVRHSGAERVDVYAELAPRRVEVFVRDRGRGFDLATVPADRYGVRRSILERLERHGGRAVVRSAPGEGTEVRMTWQHDEETV